MVWFIVAVLALVLFSLLYLRGADMSRFDGPALPAPTSPPSSGHADVLQRLRDLLPAGQARQRGRAQLVQMRSLMDGLSAGRDFACSFVPVSTADVRGEWVLAPDTMPGVACCTYMAARGLPVARSVIGQLLTVWLA
tara:strand:+ start:11493 stop:11903 length:411 start_codon:yes stop_codon:yes gene_type:complete